MVVVGVVVVGVVASVVVGEVYSICHCEGLTFQH